MDAIWNIKTQKKERKKKTSFHMFKCLNVSCSNIVPLRNNLLKWMHQRVWTYFIKLYMNNLTNHNITFCKTWKFIRILASDHRFFRWTLVFSFMSLSVSCFNPDICWHHFLSCCSLWLTHHWESTLIFS